MVKKAESPCQIVGLFRQGKNVNSGLACGEWDTAFLVLPAFYFNFRLGPQWNRPSQEIKYLIQKYLISRQCSFAPLFGVCYDFNWIWSKADAMLKCTHFWKRTKSRRSRGVEKGWGVLSKGPCSGFFGRCAWGIICFLIIFTTGLFCDFHPFLCYFFKTQDWISENITLQGNLVSLFLPIHLFIYLFLPASIFLELCIWNVKAEALGDFEEEGVGEPGLHWLCGRDLRWFSANSPKVYLIGFQCKCCNNFKPEVTYQSIVRVFERRVMCNAGMHSTFVCFFLPDDRRATLWSTLCFTTMVTVQWNSSLDILFFSERKWSKKKKKGLGFTRLKLW